MSAPASDVLVIQLHRAYGPGELAGVLQRAGLTMHLVRLHRGDHVPRDLRHMEGLVILSGPPGEQDLTRARELGRVRELLRIARGKHLPTLAIGLGAQLVALALEGRTGASAVEGSSNAPEVVELELTPEGAADPVLSTIAAAPRVLRIPTEGVRALPPASTLLAQDAQGGIGAFRVGETIWALEFHPEVDEELVRRAFGATMRLPPRNDPARAGATALLEAFSRQVLTG